MENSMRFLKQLKIELPQDQQSHSWAYTHRKPQFKKIHAPQWSLQHYLQQPGHGSNRGMDKEDVVQIYNGILLSHKTGSFVETWMDLETVIQSEVSQKEKNKYFILMHTCGIQKNGIDELICKAEIETQTQRTNVWIPRGKDGGLDWEIGNDIYTLLCIKQITNENRLYSTGNSTQRSVVT